MLLRDSLVQFQCAAHTRTYFSDRSFSISRSYRICRFIQNRSDKLEYRDSRRAVSGLITRTPCTISLIRRAGTLISFAKRYSLIPIGFKDSSRSSSPGLIGLVPSQSYMSPNVNFLSPPSGISSLPFKIDSPPTIHWNAVLTHSAP